MSGQIMAHEALIFNVQNENILAEFTFPSANLKRKKYSSSFIKYSLGMKFDPMNVIWLIKIFNILKF